MNSTIQFKTTTRPLLIALMVLCFGLLPGAQAVIPPPDGGYPGFNTAEGQNALFSLTSGTGNTAVGWFALSSNVEGGFNTATGAGALLFNNGSSNTAFGAAALAFNTSRDNTAVGALALFNNTIGSINTALGESALENNTTGSNNTAVGAGALFQNTSGSYNTAVGPSALFQNHSGNDNTALGHSAGGANMTGSRNVYIGPGTSGVAGENDGCYIGSIFGRTSTNGIPVLISSSNKLGTAPSSKRFKEDIKPMDSASEAIHVLKPVTFRYKQEIDPAGISQFGLVAEEVEKINPDLIVRDKEGKPYSVRYDHVNAMLLNEFLKEHRTVQELKKAVAALTATVKQQAEQLERVSASIELDKVALNVARNNR